MECPRCKSDQITTGDCHGEDFGQGYRCEYYAVCTRCGLPTQHDYLSQSEALQAFSEGRVDYTRARCFTTATEDAGIKMLAAA